MRRMLFCLLLSQGVVFSQYKLTLQFNNMNPHLGESFFVRVIEDSSGLEVGRSKIDTLSNANFSMDLFVLIPGRSYRVDFYADHNRNQQYDAPPADHAWRMETGKVDGNTQLSFTHNTTFTDILFPSPVQLASLAGPWNGQWINPTFSVQGDVAGTLDVDPAQQLLTAQWQAWGLFGNPGPMSFTMTAAIGPEPWVATFNAQNPWTGFVMLADGQITGTIGYAGIGIVAAVYGNYGPGQLIAYYVMSGAFNDEEYTVLHPTGMTKVNPLQRSGNPDIFRLEGNYPNPFNPTTTIRYSLQRRMMVDLKVYDLNGHEVAALVHGIQPAGIFTTDWNGKDNAGVQVPSGVYFYRLVTSMGADSRKMLLIK
jgi:hypothetical protein